jgi:hypothetical protein
MADEARLASTDNGYLRKSNRTQWLLLTAILLIAALLRAAHLGQIEHNVDHAYPIWQALTTLEAGALPLAGQGTSVLFANPALTGYLLLPGMAITRSAVSAYVLVIALNTLGVYLVFRIARRMVGVPAALVAAGLLAVNPWMIEYSRATWVQGLLPFFAAALAWALWPVLLGGSRRQGRRLILAFVILALYTQTYLLAFLVLAPVGLLMVLCWRQLPRRALLIGIAFFVVSTAVYGVGLLQQASTVQSRLSAFSSAPRQLRPESLDHALRLISGADYAIARGVDAPAGDSALRQALSQVAHGVVVAGVVAGCWWLVVGIVHSSQFTVHSPERTAISKRRSAVIRQVATADGINPVPTTPSPDGRARPTDEVTGGYTGEDALIRPYETVPAYPKSLSAISYQLSAILFLTFTLPILLMGYTGQPVHPFYQIIGIPAGHILAGMGLVRLVQWLTRSPRRAGWLLAALFIPYVGLMAVNSLRYAEETAVTAGIDGLTALPLGVGLQLGAAINAHLPAGGRVLSDGNEWILNSFSGRLYPVMNDVRAPAVQIIPAEGGLLLRAGYGEGFAPVPYAERVWEWSDVEMAGLYHLALDRYAPGLVDALPIPNPLRVEGQEGIDLLGYGWDESGNGETVLTTWWQVSVVPPGSGVTLFAPFIHVYDAAGVRVQIIDGQTVVGGDWRVGDVHVHRMAFTLPESGGPFRLEIGQFDGVAGRNVIFLPDYVPTIRLPG